MTWGKGVIYLEVECMHPKSRLEQPSALTWPLTKADKESARQGLFLLFLLLSCNGMEIFPDI